MKKQLLVVFAMAIIFACNLVMPMSVNAAQNACPPHKFSATHEDYGEEETLYVHQYLIENGSNGPVWGSCRVYKVIKTVYPRCSICGFIDYEHPHGKHDFARIHGSCGIAPYYY